MLLAVLQVFSCNLSVSHQYHPLHLDPGARPPAEQSRGTEGIQRQKQKQDEKSVSIKQQFFCLTY